MVESEAKELTEDQMLGAVLFAHDEFQVVINAVKELAAEAAKPTWTWAPQPEATALLGAIRAEFGDAISQAYTITIKADRYARLGELKDQVVAKLSGEEGQPSSSEVKAAFGEIEYRTVRENIVNGKPRIDGRDTKTVRPLNIEVGVLPKTHGSALFTRGETQALVVATLGTARDAQLLDTLEGEKKDPFMLHYNFPPFSVGECGRMGGAGRREIGHGRLARRSIAGHAACCRRVPVHHPCCVGNHRVQRFELHGFGLRRFPGPDGRRRSDEGTGCRYRHGSG